MRGRALAAAAVLTMLVGLAGCEREQRRFTDDARLSAAPERARGPYDANAWATAEGKRLYQAFNCVGCHAHGGGGIGPPLMDDQWIYGSAPADVYASIVEGRPNGMPAFGGRIPEPQVWQLVAYVRSMSGLLRKDARPGRDDHMATGPSEQARAPQRPGARGTPPPAGPPR